MKTLIKINLLALSLGLVAACGDSHTENETGLNPNENATMTGTPETAERGANEGQATSVSSFMSKARIINEMEVMAGQLAEEKASSKEVKAYAKRMIADHTAATKELFTLAGKKNIALPKVINLDDPDFRYGSQSSSAADITSHDGTNASKTEGQSDAQNQTSESRGSASALPGDPKDNVVNMGYQDKLNRLKQRVGGDFDRQYIEMMVKDHAETIKIFEDAAKSSDPDIKAFAEKMLPQLRDHERNARMILANLQG